MCVNLYNAIGNWIFFHLCNPHFFLGGGGLVGWLGVEPCVPVLEGAAPLLPLFTVTGAFLGGGVGSFDGIVVTSFLVEVDSLDVIVKPYSEELR